MTPITASFGRMLALHALAGRFTLEDLDAPSTKQHYTEIEADRRAANSRAQRIGLPPPFPPGTPWCNLARQWIEANPAEWQQLLLRSLEQEQEGSHDP